MPSFSLPGSFTCGLPGGRRVRYVSRDDVGLLYKEILLDRVQLQHGVQLEQGAVVLDVGANIGMFSCFAAELAGPEGLVLACEPLPEAFAALEDNIASHAQWCKEAGIAPSPIVPLNVGVGDGSRPSAVFTAYERAAGWATMYPSEEEVFDDMGAFLENAVEAPPGAPSPLSPPLRALGALLRRHAPRGVYEAVWHAAVARMLGRRRLVECPLRTLSDLIAQHSLQRVDLLKVDVERAELDVLRGLAPAHWPCIRQVVAEVHECNLAGALELLAGPAGFGSCEVAVDQEPDLRGTGIHMVYAVRGEG